MAPRSGFDWLLEAVAAIAICGMAVLIAVYWSDLPPKIPVHFNASGDPNRWGSKSTLWMLFAVNTGVMLLLTAAARYQGLINIPFQVDRNSMEVRQLLRRMITSIKATAAPMLTWIAWVIIRTATGEMNGMGSWFVPIFLAGTLLPAVFFTVRLWKYRIPG